MLELFESKTRVGFAKENSKLLQLVVLLFADGFVEEEEEEGVVVFESRALLQNPKPISSSFFLQLDVGLLAGVLI